MFVTSSDGTRIVYDVEGNGPALLLLQGFQEERQIWQNMGYVEQLGREFTVITMDRRGIGESDMPTDSAMYTVEKMLEDIFAVLDVCHIDRFMLWGHSFGGSIGLQLATRSDRVVRAVVAGSFFGRVYSEQRVNELVGWWESVIAAQNEGTLASLGIEQEEQEYIKQINIPATIACWRELTIWPIVEPQEVRCPMFVYSGTNDERVTKPLQERKKDIEASGIHISIFDNMDHEEELSKIDVVLPPALAFLKGSIK